MRGLSRDFMKPRRPEGSDRFERLLSPILQRVQEDDTLDLEIRKEYLNIYYRGGNLLKISRPKGVFVPHFDAKYGKSKKGQRRSVPKLPRRSSPERTCGPCSMLCRP